MEPRVGLVGRICFVRWYSAATTEQIRAVRDAMIDARRQAGRPLVFLAIMPPDLAIPDPATRREIVRLTPMMDRLCDSYFVALPGEGTARVLMRGALQITQAIIGKPFTVVRTIEEAVDGAARAAGLDPVDVLARARERGLVDDEAQPTDAHTG